MKYYLLIIGLFISITSQAQFGLRFHKAPIAYSPNGFNPFWASLYFTKDNWQSKDEFIEITKDDKGNVYLGTKYWLIKSKQDSINMVNFALPFITYDTCYNYHINIMNQYKEEIERKKQEEENKKYIKIY